MTVQFKAANSFRNTFILLDSLNEGVVWMEKGVQMGEGSEVGVIPPVTLHADEISVIFDFDI